METYKAIPVVIKLMMALVFVDAVATMAYFYLDTMSDPDMEFTDIENLISFIFPLFYFAGMVWLIRTHIPITKIIVYVVFALEFAVFISLDFESSGFDIFSMLSLVSVIALLACIQIIHSDVGKRWFVKKYVQ